MKTFIAASVPRCADCTSLGLFYQRRALLGE